MRRRVTAERAVLLQRVKFATAPNGALWRRMGTPAT
jgi:hypothetical protein